MPSSVYRTLHIMWRFTDHAIERYCERVRPGLDPHLVLRELRRVARHANIRPNPPVWVTTLGPADAWLHLAEDVCFPLKQATQNLYVATTCLTRGTLPPAVRRARNERRARRTYARVHKPRDTPRPPMVAA